MADSRILVAEQLISSSCRMDFPHWTADGGIEGEEDEEGDHNNHSNQDDKPKPLHPSTSTSTSTQNSKSKSTTTTVNTSMSTQKSKSSHNSKSRSGYNSKSNSLNAYAAFKDYTMLSIGGKERTLTQFAEVASQAGLEIERVHRDRETAHVVLELRMKRRMESN